MLWYRRLRKSKTILRRRGLLGGVAFGAPNQGLESSLCRWGAWPGLAQHSSCCSQTLMIPVSVNKYSFNTDGRPAKQQHRLQSAPLSWPSESWSSHSYYSPEECLLFHFSETPVSRDVCIARLLYHETIYFSETPVSLDVCITFHSLYIYISQTPVSRDVCGGGSRLSPSLAPPRGRITENVVAHYYYRLLLLLVVVHFYNLL